MTRRAGPPPCRALLIVLVAAASVEPVAAQPALTELEGRYKVVPERSTLAFAVEGDSDRVIGTLQATSGEVTIRPGPVLSADAELTVAADTLSVAGGFLGRLLRGGSGFDVGNHPSITFRSTQFEATGARTFHLDGRLTIRAHSEPLRLHGTVAGGSVDAPQIDLRGTVDRTRFGVVAGRPFYSKEATIVFEAALRRPPD